MTYALVFFVPSRQFLPCLVSQDADLNELSGPLTLRSDLAMMGIKNKAMLDC